MARSRLSQRLATWVAVVVIGGTAVLLGALLPLQRDAVTDTSADQVGIVADAVVGAYGAVDELRRTHDAAAILQSVAGAPHVAFVDVLDSTGTIVRSSRPAAKGTAVAMPLSRTAVHVGARTIAVTKAIPFSRDCVGCHTATDGPLGAVRVAVDRRAALAPLERFHALVGVACVLLVFFVAALVLWLVERLIARRVHQLARVMGMAESGDFLVRVHDGRDDELGALGLAFNRMLAAITTMKAEAIAQDQDLRATQEQLVEHEALAERATVLLGTNAALTQTTEAQALLIEAAHRFGSTLDRDAIVEHLDALLIGHTPHQDWVLYLFDPAASAEPVLCHTMARGVAEAAGFSRTALVGEGLVGTVADTGAPLLITDVAAPGWALPEMEVQGALGIPLLHGGQVLGVLVLLQTSDMPFTDDDVRWGHALMAQAAMALKNAELHAAAHALAITDGLTGLLNRRAFDRRLKLEVLSAARFGHGLSVLLFDVDHFKQYNDRMGHLLGDEALKGVASALSAGVRKVDAVARFGGEEFAVILPKTSAADAMQVAEKLRAAVARVDVRGADAQPLGTLSASIGLAMYEHAGDTYDLGEKAAHDLVDAADAALYTAKAGGRNRVVQARAGGEV